MWRFLKRWNHVFLWSRHPKLSTYQEKGSQNVRDFCTGPCVRHIWELSYGVSQSPESEELIQHSIRSLTTPKMDLPDGPSCCTLTSRHINWFLCFFPQWFGCKRPGLLPSWKPLHYLFTRHTEHPLCPKKNSDPSTEYEWQGRNTNWGWTILQAT